MKYKKIAALSIALALTANMALPVFAAEDTEKQNAEKSTAYLVSYSQIEQLVLDNNLQVENNELTMDNLIEVDDLKKQYEKISDSIDQTSATLAAVIGNSSATQDLKTVAAGTSAALAILKTLFASQEDASEDTLNLTELQIKQANNQLVKAAQSLFSTYHQLQYNLESLKNNRTALEDSVRAAQVRYQLGTGTAVAVEEAKASLATLNSNITDLQNQSLSIKYQMNQMLGHPYDDQIVFGKIPDPDTKYVDTIHLTDDIAEAQKASYNIQITKLQRSILNEDTHQEKDQRKAKSNDIDAEIQKISASMATQLDTIKQQQSTLSLEQKNLDIAKLKWDQANQQYELGVISSIQLNQLKSSYLNEEIVVKIAKSTLFWNIESYRWLVKGLPAS